MESEELTFNISTYLKDLIGRELLTNKYVAVFELVKNSYDAGASEVVVKFISPEDNQLPTSIAIVDNGSGMSKEDIKNKWMNVAKSYKRVMNKTADMNSTGRNLPVGSKGIGRFSCDKLGDSLDLYTKTEYGHAWNHLIARWKDFELDQDKDFESVPVKIEETQNVELAGDLHHGTILVISGLRETWDYDSVLRLKRHFQKLLDPVTPVELAGFRIKIDAQFAEKTEGSAKNGRKVNGLVESTLFDYLKESATMISAELDAGIFSTKLLDRGDELYSLKENIEKLKHVKKVNVDIFYVDRGMRAKFTRRMGVPILQYGSIFMYRNYIRVFPYGEPGNDWLGLNQRKQQGYRRYLSSRELFGRVSLIDSDGKWDEASSRDSGIKDSDALEELIKLVKDKVIARLENYIVKASDWNIPSSDSEVEERNSKLIELLSGMAVKDKNIISVKYSESLKDAVREKGAQASIENIASLSSDLDQEKRRELEKYVSSFKKSLESFESETKQAKEEAFFLRTVSEEVKAGTLKLIAEHNLNIISRRLKPALIEVARFIASAGAPPKILKNIEDALEELDLLRERNKLVMRANWDITHKEELDIPLYIEQYIKQFWTQSLDRRGIILNIDRNGISLSKPVHPEVISLVLDNLLDNSSKSSNNAFRVSINFSAIKNGNVVFTVSDDGIGVKEQDQENLFKPWSSATGGSGVGLYLMHRLIKQEHGELRFMGNGIQENMKGACFEVEI